MGGVWVVLFTCLAHVLAPRAAASVWYRGVPLGVPRPDDLAQIRALGFSAVTWPADQTAGVAELKRMAASLDLTVIIRRAPVTLTSTSALNPDEEVDVRASSLPADRLGALVWRAIAHGARVISFDGEDAVGTGLRDQRGETPAWVRPAAAIAHQLEYNGLLIGALQQGPSIAIDAPGSTALEVKLLETPRAWVMIATNLSRARVRAIAHLPKGVPYALWINLIDASELAMLSETRGPRWRIDLEPWGFRVYVIDKTGPGPI